ncbi:MAG: segregation/condensation protein A [Oscillospiraceae bacterium]|jgi:segregation and condensation protein A|nr:segregation/condensation protein A [Oscillospiraceae bacterium]
MPTFTLSDIDFTGPLTLILTLISRSKVEIRDVKISSILEQYLAYLEEMQTLNLEIAGEFIAMAAHLTYLKAKALHSEDNDSSEIEMLISSLEALKLKEDYGTIREVGAKFGELLRFDTFTRSPEPMPTTPEYRYSIDRYELFAALRRTEIPRGDIFYGDDDVYDAMDSILEAMPSEIEYTIEDKLDSVRNLFVETPEILMTELLFTTSRSELIATFLAILDLVKYGELWILTQPLRLSSLPPENPFPESV